MERKSKLNSAKGLVPIKQKEHDECRLYVPELQQIQSGEKCTCAVRSRTGPGMTTVCFTESVVLPDIWSRG